ncbi:MAG: hypothetical protein FWF06_04355 [Symbiobacteriaceae bacterium]|nr:hypothetical protein [Symbiobacteriaceae bacterium]
MLLWLFGILNLLLGYFNFVHPYQVMAERSSNPATYAKAINNLAENYITILNQPSLQMEAVPPLLLTPTSAAEVAYGLVTGFFGSTPYTATTTLSLSGSTLWRYASAKGVLEITPLGNWSYFPAEAEATDTVAPTSNKLSNYRSIAEDYLRGWSITLPPKAIYEYLPAKGEQHRAVWYLSHKNKPIFDAAITVYMSHNVVTAVHSTLGVTVAPGGQGQWINSASDILLRMEQDPYLLALAAAQKEAGSNLMIESISLGYHTSYTVALTSTPAWANPVWRVLLQGGDLLYYNAYNGQRIYP